ncbi:hypothetical protein QUF49_19775 [Fictibacillus sp. b24]|uniref:hypothetical protein n=1 Tax=Fictibacillus sp. b24 TaxID=3055863 RepID=UPI0025A0893A|nr:hypothetical protein [Fictibacillus sp. b24]MDM5318241.1 hypothetical protein [Fictibacillus sp. b24]
MIEFKRKIGWFFIAFLFFYFIVLLVITPKEYLTFSYVTDFTKHGVIHILAISLAIGFLVVFSIAKRYDNILGAKEHKRYIGRLFLNNPLNRRATYIITAMILGAIIQVIFTIINIKLMHSGYSLGIWALLLFWAIAYTFSKDISSMLSPKFRNFTFCALIVMFSALFLSILWNKEAQTIFYNLTAYFSIFWFIVLMFKK